MDCVHVYKITTPDGQSLHILHSELTEHNPHYTQDISNWGCKLSLIPYYRTIRICFTTHTFWQVSVLDASQRQMESWTSKQCYLSQQRGALLQAPNTACSRDRLIIKHNKPITVTYWNWRYVILADVIRTRTQPRRPQTCTVPPAIVTHTQAASTSDHVTTSVQNARYSLAHYRPLMTTTATAARGSHTCFQTIIGCTYCTWFHPWHFAPFDGDVSLAN